MSRQERVNKVTFGNFYSVKSVHESERNAIVTFSMLVCSLTGMFAEIQAATLPILHITYLRSGFCGVVMNAKC